MQDLSMKNDRTATTNNPDKLQCNEILIDLGEPRDAGV